MAVSLEWLLGRSELRLTLVEGDPAGVELTWAHGIELEDPTPWLAGGELLLTTGLRMPRTLAEQTAYVDRLSTASVAALAFGTGVRFAQIPRGVREACRRRGLPLIDVPLPTPFIAISQAVAARLAQQRRESLLRALNHQRRLTRTALQGGVDGLVRGLATELRCQVLLLDEHGDQRSHPPSAIHLKDRVIAEVQAPSAAGLRASISVPDDGGSLEIQSLGSAAALRGWLAVRVGAPMTGEDRLVLNQTAAMLTLQLQRPREIEQARRELGGTVLNLLLDGEPAAPRLGEHLRHFGFQSDEQVVLVLVMASRPAGSLLETVASELDRGLRTYLVAGAPASVTVLLRQEESRDAVRQLDAALASAGRHDVAIGVSAPVPAHRVASALTPARHAAGAARRERQRVGWFENLTLESVLADELVRERVQALSRSTLAPLLAGDTARDRQLLDSLEVFLQHNGSWETASRQLGVHRHTLRHRMARVEALTGLSLDVAHHRVVLLLALMTAD